MRTLRYLLAAVVLALLLAGSAYAGDMYSGYTSPPPPPQQNSTASVTGDMYSGVTSSAPTTGGETAPVDSVREIALNLLHSLLALL